MLSVLLKEAETYGPEWGILHSLEYLKEQAASEEVKIIVDRKLSEYRQAQYAEKLQQAEERERLKREQAERERIEFETRRKELIQNSNGTLRDKSAEQVKKLVDGWKDRGPWWEADSKFFSTETFYKVFGKPERTQFLSSQFEHDSYYFLYNCKDGVVQIKVRASSLDNNIVIVEDLIIF
jgi:hypothetical protein